MRDPRIDKLAEVLVKYSTNVRKDQLVLIRGPAVAGPLVLAVYRQVLLAGAHPRVMVELEEMDELFLNGTLSDRKNRRDDRHPRR
jgi:aminopeptidase